MEKINNSTGKIVSTANCVLVADLIICISDTIALAEETGYLEQKHY